jgi:hypothetical protein
VPECSFVQDLALRVRSMYNKATLTPAFLIDWLQKNGILEEIFSSRDPHPEAGLLPPSPAPGY